MQADTMRRSITTCTHEDRANGSSSGRPALYAYGRRWIARASNRSARTVRRAIKAGDLDPGDPVAVVAWCAAQRGRPELGEELRRALGHL
jgi:hypothetical protein